MRAERGLLLLSLGGLWAGLAMALLGGLAERWDVLVLPWFPAHGILLVLGFVLPGLLFLLLRIAGPLMPRPLDPARIRVLGMLWAAAAIVAGLGHLLPGRVVAFLGMLLAFAAGGMQTGTMLKALPRRGESVVDVARDPLTKGDDACFQQIRFAHFFLPLGLLLMTASYAPGLAAWPGSPRLFLAGLHLTLVGHALVAAYGLTHLAIPRYAGVPAIAAGAIKGELHSTLPGLVLLVAGFLAGHSTGVGRGLLVAAGVFVFLGIFVYMGVLGANIMKNKSRTQRVTPAFAYIPWTFAGVLWLVCGVLMGWFLNAVPAPLADAYPSLRFTHAHFALLGGIAQVYLGLLPRELAAWNRRPVLPFTGTARGAFYGLNAGLLLLVVGRFGAGVGGTAFLGGAGLTLLSLALHGLHIRKLIRPHGDASA